MFHKIRDDSSARNGPQGKEGSQLGAEKVFPRVPPSSRWRGTHGRCPGGDVKAPTYFACDATFQAEKGGKP